jgi:prevent-host-death family protein
MYMKIVPMADARANFRELLDEVEGTHERVVITRRGQPAAVLISVDDLESIEETLDVLSDPGLVTQIAEAEADVEAGRTFTLDEVAAEMQAKRRIA